MNKKELVKLLFKHPTIKSLYESPEFDNRMINQAILSEASSVVDLSDDADRTVKKAKQDTKQQGDAGKTTTQQQSTNQGNNDSNRLRQIENEATHFDKIVSPELKEEFENFLNTNGAQKHIAIFKSFLIHYLVDTGVRTLKEAEGQLPELTEQFGKFLNALGTDEGIRKSLIKIVSLDDFNKIAVKIRQHIQSNRKDSFQNNDLKQEKEKYRERAEMAVKFLNVEDNQLFVDDNFMAFLGKVLEKEGVIQEQGEEEGNYAEKYLAELTNKPEEFLLTADEAVLLIKTLTGKKEEVNKIIKAAIEASKQPQTDGDQTEASQDTDPDADADVSPMEQEKLDKEWIRTLDIFFGKNPESPSFMRRLLLRDQATMLFTMIDTLKKIELGKSADGEEQSLTNQRGKFDNKDEQPTSDKEVDNSQQQTQTTSNPAGDQASLQESLINEIFNKLFKSDNQEIKISKKTTAFMRQDLESMVNLLQSLKADIKGYERFATRSSSDPRYDGTTLKAAMDGKLETTQKSIAHLIKVIDVEIQNQINQLGKDAQQVARGDTLQEDRASDRKLRIQEVEKVYNELRRMYLKGLRISLENPDTEEAKAGAKQMREYVMGEEKFMSYFPTNIISGGKVMTLGDAYEKMSKVIRKFIETIRDIVTITKTQRVSKTDLEVVVADLVAISLAIQSMFRKESLIDRKFIENYKNEIAQDPDKQSITSEEPAENLGLAGKGLEKLKQMFGWMSDEIAEFFNKFFGEGSGIIKALKKADIKDENKKKIAEDIVEAKSWLDSLKDEEKDAVEIFVYKLTMQRLTLDLSRLEEGSDSNAHLKSFIDKGSAVFAQDFQEKAMKALDDMRDEAQRHLVENLMFEKMEEFINYLTTVFLVQEKLGAEASEELVDKVLDQADDLMQRSGLPDSSDGKEDDALPPQNVEIGDEEENREAEGEIDKLTKFISEKFMDGSGDPKKGFAEFLNKYYLPKATDADGQTVRKGYGDIYSKTKDLSPEQKKCLADWVIEIAKRMKEGSITSESVESKNPNPVDRFDGVFKNKLEDLGVSTNSFQEDEPSQIVRNALSSAAYPFIKLEGYWINQITEKPEETADMLSTLLKIYIDHEFAGLYTMVYQKFPKNTSKSQATEMYNKVVPDGEKLEAGDIQTSSESNPKGFPETKNQEDELNNGWAKDKKEDEESSDTVPDIEEEKSSLIQKDSERYQGLDDWEKLQTDMDNGDFEQHYFSTESNERINLERALKKMEFTEPDGKEIINFTKSIIEIIRKKRKEKNIQKEAAFSSNPNGSPFKSNTFFGSGNPPTNVPNSRDEEKEYKKFQKKELKTILKNLKYFLKTNGIEDEINWPNGTPKAMKIIHKYYGKNKYIYDVIAKYISQELKPQSLEESLKPIIEKMLKEHYNY